MEDTPTFIIRGITGSRTRLSGMGSSSHDLIIKMVGAVGIDRPNGMTKRLSFEEDMDCRTS